MNCPRCDVALNEKSLKGIEIDHCPECKGLWLDFHEMDQLEDHSMDDDERKGLMEYARRESDISCPNCYEVMETFNYRANNLPIDHCKNQHGYWLDEGEEKKILEIMKQRVQDLERSSSAEESWSKFLERGGARSFLAKVKDLFTG
ncbi:MAG: zf-TFIIB domain-containing protein [SAR202 cluster bacterium]|nr:zf-TFIIB domain-containing protein [SAR202 cluster bacterium]